MRSGAGIILIMVGILVLWIAVSDKYDCFSNMLACLFGSGVSAPTSTPAPTGPTIKPSGVNPKGLTDFLKTPPLIG